MMDEAEKEKRGPTKRLYFDDAYLKEFEASVVEKRERDGRVALVLDQTCFYPESGGQPWDRGTIEGIEVLGVLEEEGAILHLLKEDVQAARVRGRIDWDRRFDHMQQHTGQHILSQAFFEKVKGETRSFHLGPDLSTLEIGLAAILDEDLARIEDGANAVVWEDREVKTYFVPDEKIEKVPLRRPPKKQGLLRVVEVDGYDFSACGGTHCRRTGEVGLIKILGLEKIRGNLRFEFLCGGRALSDYRSKDRTARKLAGSFSCSVGEVSAQVEKLAAGQKALKKRARRIEERLAAFEAQEIIRDAPGPLIAAVLEDKTPDEARFLALNVIKSGDFAVIYAAKGEEQGHLIIARSDSLTVDLRKAIPVVGAAVPVKGGGGPSLIELVTSETSRLAVAVEAAASWLRANEEKMKS